MAVKGIQHKALVVQDLDKSCWFYGAALGFEQIPRPHTFTFQGTWYRAGQSEIHLIGANDTTAPAGTSDPGVGKQTGLATHTAFEVTDLEEVRTRLESHGVDIVGGPLARGDGFVQIWLMDPDGHMIEFFQWTNEDQTNAPERGAVRG
jgi:catechol 2,3-dioxygenase-like lactoylglutathione lyase family enzyme